MKQRKFNSKLVLNKTTVANLNGNEMKAVYGGAPRKLIRTAAVLPV